MAADGGEDVGREVGLEVGGEVERLRPGADGGVCFDDGPGCEPWCQSPLPDAGFTSLRDFPVARECAGSWDHSVTLSDRACQGVLIVSADDGVDFGSWWLFDAATGDLVASGSTGPRSSPSEPPWGCDYSVAGLRFPYQCFLYRGWGGDRIELCPEGGDAGLDAGDAPD